jgi:hypothetical protein
MDICKVCHEKDKNVTKCADSMNRHTRYTGFVNECDICGVKGKIIYVCEAYKSVSE